MSNARIGISAEFLGTKLNGTATYTRELLNGLAGLEVPRHHYFAYIATSAALPLVPQARHLTPRIVGPYTAWLRLPLTLPIETLRRPVDLLHVQGWGPPRSPRPMVATIHDLSWERHPEIVSLPLRLRLSLLVRQTARQSVLIIATSQATAADLERIYAVPADKIRQVYPAFDARVLSSAAKSTDVAARTRQRLGLASPYLLYVGSVEPRKNVDKLIRAYAELRRAHRVRHQLVIAGAPLRFAEPILELPSALGIHRDVKFVGRVPQSDLAGLYAGADAFAFLGACEGFGFPPLEAMALGVPTAVADRASLPEVVGEAALKVDPFDHAQVVRALERLLTEPELQARLREAGPRRARVFDPASMVRQVVDVYDECLDLVGHARTPAGVALTPAPRSAEGGLSSGEFVRRNSQRETECATVAATLPSARIATRSPFVCPRCSCGLVEAAETVNCVRCAAEFPRLTRGYADFAPDRQYADWWSSDPAVEQWWLTHMAPKDERFQMAGAARVVVPLLKRLGYQPGQATVLSAACGLGADVDALNAAGYQTWGIDCGSRSKRWTERSWAAHLARADMLQLPFAEASFDLVLALNALEHVGMVGDTAEVEPDYMEQRLRALRSLVRVTRPGGYVLLSGPARRFPLDFFHTPLQGQTADLPPARDRLGKVRRRVHHVVRPHAPWEAFLLSFGDQAQLARETGEIDWVRPLSLRGFFAYSNLSRHAAMRPIIPVLDWLLGGLPVEVYGSWLSFFTIVLLHRRPPASASVVSGGHTAHGVA